MLWQAEPYARAGVSGLRKLLPSLTPPERLSCGMTPASILYSGSSPTEISLFLSSTILHSVLYVQLSLAIFALCNFEFSTHSFSTCLHTLRSAIATRLPVTYISYSYILFDTQKISYLSATALRLHDISISTSNQVFRLSTIRSTLAQAISQIDQLEDQNTSNQAKMQFTTIAAAASALFTLASAGTVHFVNQDSTTRTLVFTPNSGYESISDLTIQGDSTANQTFPTGWIGNWYSVSDGAAKVPGMLGEVSFDSYAGSTFFDVSAIVNPDDHNGVKEMFPLHSNTPVSGCQSFPCENAYNKWDDIQTQSTDGNELVCLLGNLSSSQKRSMRAKMSRDYVTGVVV